ncbi:MAG: glycoside hydrolase family 130 protein [Phycisphaeraceae bacterium]
MLDRQLTHCMIRPEDIRPSSDAMRVVGVLNPGAAAFGDGVILLVRVVEQPDEERPGYIASPRIAPDQNIVIDWLEEDAYHTQDPRLVTHKQTGEIRLRFISYLKVVHSADGIHADGCDGPVIMPEGPDEVYGIEDPRITRIGNTYYITYVAVSPFGISTALMSTIDFVSFRRHGIIFCPDNKDVVLFPEKIMAEYVALHRPSGAARFSPPEVWLARSPDLIHWGSHVRLLGADQGTLQDRLGGGTPPIRTREGWLSIYHRSEKQDRADVAGVYSGYSLLLDLDNPAKILGRSIEPVITPTEPFETSGFLGNVVFPTGLVEQDQQVLVYYGAADECVGVVALSRADLIDSVHAAAAC